MRRNRLSLIVISLVAVCALALPATADARPALSLQPGRSDVVAVTSGIGYAVNVEGLDISYRATRVPRVPVIGSITAPGSCTTVAVDVRKAIPYVPEILALINGGDVDIVALIAKLIQEDIVTDFHLLSVADSNGVVSGRFRNLPRAAYLVASVCNANTKIYGATVVFVISPAIGMGSSDGGSSAGSTGNGSEGNGSEGNGSEGNGSEGNGSEGNGSEGNGSTVGS